MSNKDVRDQVICEIMDVMRSAKERGHDPWAYAAKTFPGTPTGVIADAYCRLDAEAEEAWWEGVERTIDGEVIRRAIASSAGDKA